jgi:tRNA (guanine-N7-)-methyltransferase
MSSPEIFTRHIRSFVRRDGRMTDARRRVLAELWPHFGLEVSAGMQQFTEVFGRPAPVILEIGFGSGASLLEIARAHPDKDFIGIETYQPGMGTLLLGIEQHALKNIRLYYADAVDVLTQCIPDNCLAGMQIFFPDPWPKRRHHKRRLIQPTFVERVTKKLVTHGIFHLATDWEHYARQMMQVLGQSPQLLNLSGAGNFSPRSSQRLVTTKFEQRGEKSGRAIWELQFARAEAG